MRTTLIPQNLPSTIAPISIRNVQDNLSSAQLELSTSRWSDVGYKLAEQTGVVLDVRAQIGLVETFQNTNAIVDSRAELVQISIAQMVEEAQTLFDASVAAHSSQVGSQVVENVARQGMQSIISSVNASISGVYVFGGINSGTQPMDDYFQTPAPTSKSAVDAAFLAEFGFTQSDPAVNSITPAAMENFIDNAFGSLFDLPSWKADWSTATDETAKTRISFSETTETSQTANESAIRKLAMAYTMVADLGLSGQNDATLELVMEKTAEITGEAIGELNQLGGKVGVTQQRIETAGEKLVVQKNVFERLVIEKENVDSYEVATRITALTNQLEASYTLTARLQQLSLVKYL